MTTPTVFISYSHKDEEWKDRLVTHLGVLQQQGLLDLWDDRRIERGHRLASRNRTSHGRGQRRRADGLRQFPHLQFHPERRSAPLFSAPRPGGPAHLSRHRQAVRLEASRLVGAYANSPQGW